MASVDDAETNKKFAEQHNADFPILADPGKKTAMAYGVINVNAPPERQVAQRWTFYIGADGKILEIDKKPTTQTAGTVMQQKLDALGIKKKS